MGAESGIDSLSLVHGYTAPRPDFGGHEGYLHSDQDRPKMEFILKSPQ